MSDYWRRRVIDQLAWGEQQRRIEVAHPLSTDTDDPAPRGCSQQSARSSAADPITAALKLAHAETEMDVAVLGEVCDGREVVRVAAGDLRSFGLVPGASMPIEDTYCHRLLTGRLSNFVPDAHADEQLQDLEITRAARVGAYLGVPLTALDARVYVLCCLAHEQRPRLGQRDVLFLRGLGEAILAQLEERRTRAEPASDLTPAR